jgi:hypothetical protein
MGVGRVGKTWSRPPARKVFFYLKKGKSKEKR